jgi:hypothetical protein
MSFPVHWTLPVPVAPIRVYGAKLALTRTFVVVPAVPCPGANATKVAPPEELRTPEPYRGTGIRRVVVVPVVAHRLDEPWAPDLNVHLRGSRKGDPR